MIYLLLSAAAWAAAWAVHRASGGEQPPFRLYDDAGCADGRSYGAHERRS